MNRFQAMARIMAILCAGDRLPKGSPKYKIARQLVAEKIRQMGPDAAFSKARWNAHELLEQIEELHRLKNLGRF